MQPQAKRPTELSGTLRVTLSTTGLEVDSTFSLADGDCGTPRGCSTALAPGVATDIVLPAGRHRVYLVGLERNCTAPGNGTVAVNVIANSVVKLRLDVTCIQYAFATVTVTVSGPGAPAFFPVACLIEPCGNQTARAGGPATLLKVHPGMQTVWLGNDHSFCTVTDGDTREFQVAPGDTVPLTFQVDCVAPGLLRLGVRFVGIGRDESIRAVNGFPCSNDWDMCVSYQIDFGQPVEFRMIGQSMEFQLADLDPGCSVVGPTTLTTYVAPGQTVELTFDVDCR